MKTSREMHIRYKLLKLLIILAFIKSTTEYCYELKMYGFRTTDSTDYKFFMNLHPNQTLSSVTNVLKEVPTPMWNLVLAHHQHFRKVATEKTEPPKILYNTTIKTCDLWRHLKRIRIFKNVAENLFMSQDAGNMSLKCPLTVGTYVMLNIHIPADTGILKFMYVPNSLYTLYGNVYSQIKRDKLELKASYEINATVVKVC